MRRNRYTRKKNRLGLSRLKQVLRLAVPRVDTPEGNAPAGRPYSGRVWLRLGLLGLAAAGAVYLSLISINILVVGTDDVDYSQRTDTLILLHWRPLPRRLAILSVPRDTLVSLPKRGPLKINAVYAYSKALNGPAYALAMTRACIENLLGVRIHSLIHIRYSGFITLVDAVGGVPVYVSKRMQYTDRAGGLYIDLQPGYQLLDGRRALDYVRFRHDEEGDLGRIRRQQEFIKAFVSQLAGVARLPRTLRAFYTFLHQVETDLAVPSALFLAMEFKGVIGRNWRRAILPGQAVFIEGRSYWRTDPADVRRFMAELGRPAQSRTAPPAATQSAAAAASLPAAPVAANTPQTKGAVRTESAVASPGPDRVPRSLLEPVPTVAGRSIRRVSIPAVVKLPAGSQPAVRVLNGCGVDGICKRVADRLTGQRIRVRPGDITNAPNFEYASTLIKTNAKNLPWAHGIAKMLGLEDTHVQLVPARVKYPTVTVVVGQDYREWLHPAE